MARILIAYGTIEGQSGKIANFISDELLNHGHQVVLFDTEQQSMSVKQGNHDNVKNISTKDNSVAPQDYDGTIVGGGLHMQRYPKHMRQWVKLNGKPLTNHPSAFYSVCLSIVDKIHPETSIPAAHKVAEKFLQSSEWKPALWDVFGGALMYSKYGFFKRHLMKWISSKSGGDTDMKRDHEYTDWEQVRRFTKDFENALATQQSGLAPTV